MKITLDIQLDCLDGVCQVFVLTSYSLLPPFYASLLENKPWLCTSYYTMKWNIIFYLFLKDEYYINDLKFIHEILFLFLHLCMQLLTEIITNAWIVIHYVELTESLVRQMFHLLILFWISKLLSADSLFSIVHCPVYLHITGQEVMCIAITLGLCAIWMSELKVVLVESGHSRL